MVMNTIRRALRERLCDQRRINLETDEVFDLLAVERRRELIRHVSYGIGPGETMEIGDAALYIASIENDKHPEEVTSQEENAARVSLHQAHLLKLDAADVVEWDRDAGTIARGPNVDPLAQLLGDVERATAAASSAARYLPEPSPKESSVSETYAA